MEIESDQKYIQLDKGECMSDIITDYLRTHPQSSRLKIDLCACIQALEHIPPLSEMAKVISRHAFFAGIRYAKIHPERVCFISEEELEK